MSGERRKMRRITPTSRSLQAAELLNCAIAIERIPDLFGKTIRGIAKAYGVPVVRGRADVAAAFRAAKLKIIAARSELA